MAPDVVPSILPSCCETRFPETGPAETKNAGTKPASEKSEEADPHIATTQTLT